MRKKGKGIAGFICFILALTLVLYSINRVFIPKWNTTSDAYMGTMVRGFYEEPKNSIDTVFLGDSSIYRAFMPTEAFKQNKQSSYIFASPRQRTWTSYYILEEILRYQSPKVIFFEVNELRYADDPTTPFVHKVFDYMKLGKPKIDAINDKAFELDNSEKAEFYFPLLKYHNRYDNLSSDDFKQAFATVNCYAKGYAMDAETREFNYDPNYMKKTTDNKKLDSKVEEYMNKIVNLCDEKGIKLVLLKVPNVNEWNDANARMVQQYADNNNLDYLDLNYDSEMEEIAVKDDYGDRGIHLNVYGAQKVTTYLSDYMKNELNVPEISDKDLLDHYAKATKTFDKKKDFMINKAKKK